MAIKFAMVARCRTWDSNVQRERLELMRDGLAGFGRHCRHHICGKMTEVSLSSPHLELHAAGGFLAAECCQHLVREYEEGGETAAAMLIKKIGYDKAEAVKELAYYLYDVCSNKRQDAKEATSYNALIAGWNDIMRMADSIHDTDTTRQASLF